MPHSRNPCRLLEIKNWSYHIQLSRIDLLSNLQDTSVAVRYVNNNQAKIYCCEAVIRFAAPQMFTTKRFLRKYSSTSSLRLCADGICNSKCAPLAPLMSFEQSDPTMAQ